MGAGKSSLLVQLIHLLNLKITMRTIYDMQWDLETERTLLFCWRLPIATEPYLLNNTYVWYRAECHVAALKVSAGLVIFSLDALAAAEVSVILPATPKSEPSSVRGKGGGEGEGSSLGLICVGESGVKRSGGTLEILLVSGFHGNDLQSQQLTGEKSVNH